MIFGLNLPNYSSLGNRESKIGIAASAEELGYSSLWRSDHILIPSDLPEPFGKVLETFTTLSYLAARTETIRLATDLPPGSIRPLRIQGVHSRPVVVYWLGCHHGCQRCQRLEGDLGLAGVGGHRVLHRIYQ